MLVGYLANTVLPVRLGEFIRSHYVGSREGVSRMSVLGTVFTERVLDVITLLGVSAVGWWFLGAPDDLGDLLLLVVQGVCSALVLVLVIVLMMKSPVVSKQLRTRVPSGVRRTIGKFRAGMAVVRVPHTFVRAGVLTLAAWGATAMAFLSAGMALGIPLTLPEAVLIAAAANLATAVPSGPAYVGTFELAVIAVSRPLGIEAVPSLAIALLVHAAILVTTVAGGSISLAVLGGMRLTLAPATVPADPAAPTDIPGRWAVGESQVDH
jgi:uncharacterized membrane protein YbhN (UPF0104 family)